MFNTHDEVVAAAAIFVVPTGGNKRSLTPYRISHWSFRRAAVRTGSTLAMGGSIVLAMPGPRPLASYRSQMVHFGLSIKDDLVEYPKR